MKKTITPCSFFLLILLFGVSCTRVTNKYQKGIQNNTDNQFIEGEWELLSYQPQTSAEFIKMEGVIVKKMFYNSRWMSVAYKMDSNIVVHAAGGGYQLSTNQLVEAVDYHLGYTPNIGKTNVFKVEINGDTLYQSGILSKGTAEEYKIEEYWIKRENNHDYN